MESVDVLQLPQLLSTDGAWMEGVRFDALRLVLFGKLAVTFGRRAGRRCHSAPAGVGWTSVAQHVAMRRRCQFARGMRSVSQLFLCARSALGLSHVGQHQVLAGRLR